MRRLILKMSMSLDGFVAGPKGEIDWLFRTPDPAAQAWTVAAISNAGLHAMGHKTFRDMAAYWPTSTEVFAAPMNDIPKVVFAHGGIDVKDSGTTRALEDARAQGSAQRTAAADVMRSWTHPRVATGDLAEEVAKLKQEAGKDIIAHGGSAFAQGLVQRDLVDEFRLLVHPVVLGRGLPLFAKAEAPLQLELVEVTPFPKGSVGQTYKRAQR